MADGSNEVTIPTPPKERRNNKDPTRHMPCQKQHVEGKPQGSDSLSSPPSLEGSGVLSQLVWTWSAEIRFQVVEL